ncbi:MAG: hypothetical protein M1832_003867 [Thelocarpon impressellum]|nr:MAG: hypothetical protein M1832_003867 [Thelocarpon impressellum]
MASSQGRAHAPSAGSVKSTSPVSVASSGTKRKRGDQPKFYSVRVGHNPGIYYSWGECLEQIRGFKKATFKSFTSLADAESFLTGMDPSQDPDSSSYDGARFYGVQRGRVPGVYSSWAAAQKQITGWKQPKHKCFASRAEAEAFVKADAGGLTSPVEAAADPAGTINNTDAASRPPAKKKQRKNASEAKAEPAAAANGLQDFELGSGPLPPDAEDGFDPNITLNPATGQIQMKSDWQRQQVRLQANGPKKGGILRIYTDGSSLGNGQHGAVSGVGVYFGDGDDRNVSEALAGPRQTNQRAELTAVYRALDIAPRHREVCIYTDSSYSINCVTVWHLNWKRNNWRTSAGKAVENRDLIEDILRKIEERNALNVETTFQWIKGHANDPGNVEADRLAVNGARTARG